MKSIARLLNLLIDVLITIKLVYSTYVGEHTVDHNFSYIVRHVFCTVRLRRRHEVALDLPRIKLRYWSPALVHVRHTKRQ